MLIFSLKIFCDSGTEKKIILGFLVDEKILCSVSKLSKKAPRQSKTE